MNILPAAEIRGKVDFGVLTIREDEYKAVLAHLPTRTTIRGEGFYEYARLGLNSEGDCGVAVARSLEQGQGSSHDKARDMIADLDPRWILLVGIAGGVPADEYSLGDVLLASRIYDFSVSAEIQEGDVHTREWNVTGGAVHPVVGAVLEGIPGWDGPLGKWNLKASIKMTKPSCEVPSGPEDPRFYGSLKHREKTHESLLKHFPPGRNVRRPLFFVAPVASGNMLVKDADVVAEWKRLARASGFVEMEAGGVYRAAHRQSRIYPVLVIRGLSDIVGFKRSGDWTTYACHTAAAFAVAFIKCGRWVGMVQTEAGAPPAPSADPAPPPAATSVPRPETESEALAREMAGLSFVEIEQVTKFLLGAPAAAGADLTLLSPEEKLRKNGLTEHTRELLFMGLIKASLVRKYVEHQVQIDQRFPDRLKAAFLNEYHRLHAEGVRGDDLFDALEKFASRSSASLRLRAAALAVLTYLFELCEVFEK